MASSKAIDSSHVAPVIKIGANYAAIMPFGFVRNLEHPEVIYNSNRQWFGETKEGVKQYIDELRKEDIKIMLKPQIWVWRGEFTGHINMVNEENWEILEETYAKFILDYAALAEEVNAEILCIATELENFITNRPLYWDNLIAEIKKVYKGKLTYAANWDEFKRTSFWDKLDYIGIDAYFPVSDEKTPSLEKCLDGWEEHKALIKKLSNEHKKPILFTEFGYRSMDYSGKEPWNSDHTIKSINQEAQVNTTKALFETFWTEEWFAGGFVWKWFHNHQDVGGRNNNQFTPQNKPVEAVIKTYYSKE